MLRAACRSALNLLPVGVSNKIRSYVRRTPAAGPALSYNETHVNQACGLASGVEGKTVLVVGASHGQDCKLFVDRGAAAVVGLDVTSEIGSDFRHERVSYHTAPIEQSGLPANTYDLVFATATMEHVPGIERGFSEMARLAKPGGFIFSLASPLWHSPYGHHMGCFSGHPWIHLVLTEEEIVSYAKAHGIHENNGHPIEAVVSYMLNREFFNMRPAADYLAAVAAVSGIEKVRNLCHMELDRGLLTHPLGKRALTKFPEEELMAVTHEFSARKSSR